MSTRNHEEAMQALETVFADDLAAVADICDPSQGPLSFSHSLLVERGHAQICKLNLVQTDGIVVAALRYYQYSNWLANLFRRKKKVYGAAIFRACGQEARGQVVDDGVVDFTIDGQVWRWTYGDERSGLICPEESSGNVHSPIGQLNFTWACDKWQPIVAEANGAEPLGRIRVIWDSGGTVSIETGEPQLVVRVLLHALLLRAHCYGSSHIA